MTVSIDSLADMTPETARRVAWGGEGVRLGPSVRPAMAAARARLMRLLEDPEVVIYGVTSGYGQNAHQRFTPEERRIHAAKPMGPVAASWGDPLPERAARAICFARLANMVEGHSGARPEVAEAVAAMLDGPMPPVPTRGQGGAGEILSLGHLFGPLARGMTLEEKDMVVLVNGSPAATGLALDAALAGRARLELAAEVLSLGFEAFRAPMEHLDPALEGYWANDHDAWALRRMRGLIGAAAGARRPYQAPVSFRIAPRILGAAHRAVSLLERHAAEALKAVTDNPVLLPPAEAAPHGRVISTGGFHNPQAPAAMDAVTAASADLATIAERMVSKLQDAAVSLLPAQLGGGQEGRAYLGTLGFAAAGYAEEARSLATATLLPGSEGGGFGQNDVASPVFLAWRKQERAGVLLESALATLCPVALRALDLTGREAPEALAKLAGLTRESSPEAALHVPGPPTGALAERFRNRVYSL